MLRDNFMHGREIVVCRTILSAFLAFARENNHSANVLVLAGNIAYALVRADDDRLAILFEK